MEYNEIYLQFHIDDEDLARLIAAEKLPEGATANVSPPGIEAGVGSGVFIDLHITFNATIPITLIVAAIISALGKSKKKQGRINNKMVKFQQPDILGFIKQIMALEKADNANKDKDDDKDGT